jgi:hypothetical protein
MAENTDFKHARFVPQSGPDKDQPVEVHFNPASLQYTVSNTLEKQGSGTKSKQFVSQSTAKLTMDLIFDTTSDGQDVRIFTEKVARFMMPDEKKVPPVIVFEWGTYKFQGMMEAYKETLDFFAPSGVPLRASVNLTLSKQDEVFAPSAKGEKVNTAGSLGVSDPSAVQAPPGRDASSLSAGAGDPRAARSIAEANGLESLRFSGSASATVGASVTLGAPSAFAAGSAGVSGGGGIGVSGGGGIGVSGGGGIGVSGGGGIGVSGGGGIGISAGGSIGLDAGIGGRSSAGVSATEGAFAGLRTARQAGASSDWDPKRLLPRAGSPGVATDAGASFGVGGQATTEAASSQRADVGAKASLQFED